MGIDFIPPQITIIIVYKYFIDFVGFINFIDFIDDDDDPFARTTHISASSSGLLLNDKGVILSRPPKRSIGRLTRLSPHPLDPAGLALDGSLVRVVQQRSSLVIAFRTTGRPARIAVIPTATTTLHTNEERRQPQPTSRHSLHAWCLKILAPNPSKKL